MKRMRKYALLFTVFFVVDSLSAQPAIDITIEDLTLLEVNFGDRAAEEIGELRVLLEQFEQSLNETLIPLIEEKIDALEVSVLGFLGGFIKKNRDPQLEKLTLEQLILKRSTKMLGGSTWYYKDNQKLQRLYSHYLNSHNPALRGLISLDPPDPLEIFDSGWVLEAIALDQQILLKRAVYWKSLPDDFRRILEIEEKLTPLQAKHKRLNERVQRIMSQCDGIMTPKSSCEQKSANEREQANAIAQEMYTLEQEKKKVVAGMDIHRIPELPDHRYWLFHDVFDEIPVEVLLL